MKVFMIGGTGLLGSEAAAELIRRGHGVKTLALPPLPPGAPLPAAMEIELGNYVAMTDAELAERMRGSEVIVFAAGVDERVDGPPPIYDLYKKYNIDPVRRLLGIAKGAGLKGAVILGSYFSYFHKKWPQLELTRWHPYIKSRIEQEEAALAFADSGFSVAVLELPYIFGTQPGRKPVWTFLIESLRKMRLATFYTRGGTTMVTVRQVGQAIASAAERNRGGNCYPIGYYNLSWAQLLTVMNEELGFKGRRVLTIPDWTFSMSGRAIMRQKLREGHQTGLDLGRYAKLQCAKLFIDKAEGCDALGVGEDDIEAAILASVRLSAQVLDGRTEAIGMKAE
jgi:dihydroflavonol-4-reductase